jgi:hypothetical protein
VTGFLWSLAGPSRLEIGHSCPLGDGVAVTRERWKVWRVTHTDFTGGTYLWRHIEGLAGSMKTRTRYDIYDGEGSLKSFYGLKLALEYAKQQALALAAAKRLGYEGGKAGLF